MSTRGTKLSRKFALGISKAFSSPQFRKPLLKATPGFEPKDKYVAKRIQGYLKAFMNVEDAQSTLAKPLYDWEGKGRRGSGPKRYYPILGFKSFPDAAVLAPFKCAFEFDREPRRQGSGFKTTLMKAAVHVLSGAYDACVFVYILQPRSSRHTYLEDGSSHTRILIKTLEAAGLFVTFITR